MVINACMDTRVPHTVSRPRERLSGGWGFWEAVGERVQSCEAMSGPPDRPGEFAVGDSPRWKQRQSCWSYLPSMGKRRAAGTSAWRENERRRRAEWATARTSLAVILIGTSGMTAYVAARLGASAVNHVIRRAMAGSSSGSAHGVAAPTIPSNLVNVLAVVLGVEAAG